MSLRHSYTLIAPIYDLFINAATRRVRKNSLRALGDVQGQSIRIDGIGSGLDIPFLPQGALYIGVDYTPAMLQRAIKKSAGKSVTLHVGDAMSLPYPDSAFDAIIMHLILAVVPRSERALLEAARVLKPGGRILILDKFLRRGQHAPLRRLLSPLLGRIATRTDVVFEDVLAACPQLTVVSDTPVLGQGWFRHIVLEKRQGGHAMLLMAHTSTNHARHRQTPENAG